MDSVKLLKWKLILGTKLLFCPTLRIDKLFCILHGVICNLSKLYEPINYFLYHRK